MAKAYYFNNIPTSDPSPSMDEAACICNKMMQIVIATLKEYELHLKDNGSFSHSQEKKLLSDEKSLCCVYPDKCDPAWDHSTWDYSKDKSGEIFVILKKDNKIVISFGTNRIAKKSTNEEIISRIKEKAIANGILSEESSIYETKERTVEKPERPPKTVPDKPRIRGEQIIEKTDEKTVYKRICYHCDGSGKVQVKETMRAFSKDRTDGDAEHTCPTCNGTGYVTMIDYVGKYRTGKEVSIKELNDYLEEECKILDKIFDLIETIRKQYIHVTEKDSFWLLLKKEQGIDDYRTKEDKTTTFSFILDSAGNLRCTESYQTIVITGQGTQWRNGNKGDVAFQNFDEYMREFDFYAHGHHANKSFLEYTYMAKDYEWYAGRPDTDIAVLKRNYDKGYGLYYALKNILEEGKPPLTPKKPAAVDKPGEADNKKSSDAGCYIATAVYGSYDCPEVWTLRRYRDHKLARTVWGRIFIKIYYTISPTIVRFAGDTRWFNKIWRYLLNKIVFSLWAGGFDNSPYEDKIW